LRILITKVVNT